MVNIKHHLEYTTALFFTNSMSKDFKPTELKIHEDQDQ